MASYISQINDPRWIARKKDILERDDFQCQGRKGQCRCGEKQGLTVHHTRYIWGLPPWLYPDHLLITLCEACHEWQTKKQRVRRARKLRYFFPLRRAKRFVRRRA